MQIAAVVVLRQSDKIFIYFFSNFYGPSGNGPNNFCYLERCVFLIINLVCVLATLLLFYTLVSDVEWKEEPCGPMGSLPIGHFSR